MTGTLTVGDAATTDASAEHEPTMTPEQMVAGHEEGISAFPAATTGQGNIAMAPTVLADGTKEFRLVADEIEWEVAPGEVKQGMAYNGMIPGPRIDADLGDRVRIVLDNSLEVPTALHSHGLFVPSAMDGAPGITQDPIMPGEAFRGELTPVWVALVVGVHSSRWRHCWSTGTGVGAVLLAVALLSLAVALE